MRTWLSQSFKMLRMLRIPFPLFADVAYSSSLSRIVRRYWGYRARYRSWSRYADWWRLVHSLWCGNAANIHFEDRSSRLSDPATDDEHWPKDTGSWRFLLSMNVLLKNNIVIKKNVNENATNAAKTMWMINCAKFNDCILWIQPWQNQRKQSVNNFWSCVLGNHTSDKLSLVIKVFLAAFIGKTDCNTLPAPSRKWASTECQRFVVMRLGKSHLR